MPSVPWIRLYTSFPRHRKTMALRRILGTSDPILGLWCWASENAPDGDLSGFTPDELETVSGWIGERGKAFKALCDVGFIDVVSVDVSANRYTLHEWEDHAGAGISSYLSRRERQRDLMRDRRSGDPEDQSKKKKEKKSVAITSATTLALTECAEPACAAPALVTFPCSGKPDVWGMTEGHRSEWAAAYPGVDVLGEARKALAWVNANPTKRKTARGMAKFLLGWMGRVQNSGGSNGWNRPPHVPAQQSLRVGHTRAEDFNHSDKTGEVDL